MSRAALPSCALANPEPGYTAQWDVHLHTRPTTKGRVADNLTKGYPAHTSTGVHGWECRPCHLLPLLVSQLQQERPMSKAGMKLLGATLETCWKWREQESADTTSMLRERHEDGEAQVRRCPA